MLVTGPDKIENTIGYQAQAQGAKQVRAKRRRLNKMKGLGRASRFVGSTVDGSAEK